MRRIVSQAILLIVLLAALVVRADDKKEAKLIADLGSNDPRVVDNALGDLESLPHPSPAVLAAGKKLLSDPVPTIRVKAALVIGRIHAEVDENDIKAICFMLKSHDQKEADGALKSLRGLNATSAIPQIIPLLKSPHPLVVRDACRTLAVLGNKDQIPAIEPLLGDPNKDVKKDAQDAIAALRAKP